MRIDDMTFDDIFERLIDHEGGYVFDKNDTGGETKFGISKRSYPDVDIKNLTLENAKHIYIMDFWKPLNGDKLYDGVAFQLFDFAVHSGCTTAIRIYQRSLGVADDGYFGPHSLEMAKSISEPDQIMRLIAERMRYMVKSKTWKHHGAGWINRMAKNLYLGAEDS
jgi:lysozyme family protein